MSLTHSDQTHPTRATRALIRHTAARLAGRERGRDRQVHRESYDVHDSRAQVSRRCADGTEAGTLAWTDAWVKTAREFDLFERQKGKPRPLKDTGIVVLEAVLRGHWHDFKSGRIEPALSQIQRATGYVRQTIVDALARLERHGFLGWVRRTERIHNPMPGGPTRQQINNSYFVEESRLASRAGRNVRDRFRQLLARARTRVALKAKQRLVVSPPLFPTAARRPEPECELSKALADLGAAVDRGSGPSLDNGLSPPSE